MLKNWATLPDGKEKYHLFLASRDWALKKESVKARSGGSCERCKNAPGEQVHHQTYERKYHEDLADLVHLCTPCHEFLSGKRHRDPIWDAPAIFMNCWIRRVYLAGKITGDDWRDEIVGDWSEENHSSVGESISYDDGAHEWILAQNSLRVPGGQRLDMTGPFWVSQGGGHGWSSGAVGKHLAGDYSYVSEHRGERDRVTTKTGPLLRRIDHALSETDLLFAWIDSLDCYGTLFELGQAFALRMKRVVIAMPPNFDDREIWLSIASADIVIRASSPGLAWSQLWSADLVAGWHFPPREIDELIEPEPERFAPVESWDQGSCPQEAAEGATHDGEA